MLQTCNKVNNKLHSVNAALIKRACRRGIILNIFKNLCSLFAFARLGGGTAVSQDGKCLNTQSIRYAAIDRNLFPH